MTYRAVFEREPDGRWTVHIPKVKGCHRYGRTIGQARDRIREALGLFVDNAESAIEEDVCMSARSRERCATPKRYGNGSRWLARGSVPPRNEPCGISGRP